MDILLPVIITGVIGILLALLLAVASKYMAVKEDERAVKINDALPGANCGGCGYAGCADYAAALASGKTSDTSLCAVGGKGCAAEIAEILGVECVEKEQTRACVHCGGDCSHNKSHAQYQGISTCRSAMTVFGGERNCVYGCLGYGDCAAVCPSDAICISDGIAHILPHRCTGCSACVKECPKGIISLIPIKKSPAVACSNKDKGAITRVDCSVGCIGCMKCQKICPESAITVTDNLARIDYGKCVNCLKCIEVCPAGCIVRL